MHLTTLQKALHFWVVPSLICLGLLAAVTPSSAQKKNESFQYHIRKSPSPIVIDGVEEAAWMDTEIASDFYMVLPMDTSKARVRTDVRMTYDENNLYLIAICYHALPGPYYVESLKRDFVFGKNDNFLLFVDPFDDQTNGFSFGANAAGAQWDGIMYEGWRVDLSWDNKWTSSVKNYDDRYIFEMAVPFKTIRYKKGITRWGINFSRLDLKTTEKSSWAPVPRQFPTASLAYTGILVWDNPPPPAGMNVSLIPYALGGLTRDFENERPLETRQDIGADAKIAVTSSLNLDLTVNPDFSQVDVDQQVINLDRYELFFPEKRQFFLENGDLFANFGYSSIRPFFSRRIGLGVPIRFGSRLSGKLNRNWRIGAMDMQTAPIDSIALPAQNFAVFALQRRVFARSNIGLLVVNKESLNYTPDPSSGSEPYSRYNRNIGLEYNLASSNNLWTGKFLLFKSLSPGVTGKDVTHAANVEYRSRKWQLLWQHEYVGMNYNAEVGYVPRNGYFRIYPQVNYLFFPKGTKVLTHGPTVSSSVFFDDSFERTDNETSLGYAVTFRNRSTLSTMTTHTVIRLLRPFDPTNSGKDTLATGSVHRWDAIGLDFASQPQKLFTYGLTLRYGGYYADGTRYNMIASVGYRFQPFVSISALARADKIDLPQPWGGTTFWLLGPRMDVTMTNNLFLTTYLQYNQQQKNTNLNIRFQWRYRPASDLFLVYTDNYLPENGNVKNRAVVLKFNYWLNL